MDFSTIKITSKKVSETTWIFRSSKKVRGKNVDISTSKILPKKYVETTLDLSTIEITSEKVRGNDVDFFLDHSYTHYL